MKKYFIYLLLFSILGCNNVDKINEDNLSKENSTEDKPKLKVDSCFFSNTGGLIFSIKSGKQNLYALTDEAVLILDTSGSLHKKKYLLPKNKNIADFIIHENDSKKIIYFSNMDSVFAFNEDLMLTNSYKGNQYFIQNERFLIVNSLDSNGIIVFNVNNNNNPYVIKNQKLMLGLIYNNKFYNLSEDNTINIYDLGFRKLEKVLPLEDSTLSFIAAFHLSEKSIDVIDINDEQIFYKIFSNEGVLLKRIVVPISLSNLPSSLSDYSPSLIEAVQKLIIFPNSTNNFYLLIPNITKNKLYKITVVN